MERRIPDTGKLEALTGWRATRSLEDVIEDVIEHERVGAATKRAR
jgi:nucleoside-diphosphate-sugar epimerase